MPHVMLIHKDCGGPVEQTRDGAWYEQRCRRCGAKREWQDGVVTREVELQGGSERLARGYDLAHSHAGTAGIHPLPGSEERGVAVPLPYGTASAPAQGHVVSERGNDND